MKAAEKGFDDIMQLLLDSNAIIDKTDNSGWSAFHLACYNNHITVSKLLASKGAYVSPSYQKYHRSIIKSA